MKEHILNYGGIYIMKRDVMKNVLRVLVSVLVIGCIWTVTDKIFLTANTEEKITERLDLLPAGSVIENRSGEAMPAVVRNLEIRLRYDGGNEMIKHYDVQGKGQNSNIYGYVQIWKTQQSLAHYLKTSREYMSANVFGFREETLKMNGITWQLWHYIVNDVSVAQAFSEQDGRITMCSLCVPYQEQTYEFEKILKELLESVIA